MIWTLILKFHIHEYFHVSNQDVSRSDDRPKIPSPALSKSTKNDKNQNEISNTRQLLIDKFNRKFGLNISNFKSDWRDGFNILKIIDKLKPNLNAVQAGLALQTNRERLDLGLNLANEHLNVRKLLDAEDIDLENPDDKSLITYLSQFLQKYPSLDQNVVVQPPARPPVDTSKLFEESLLSHECRLVQEFIDKVYITGINLQNVHIYSNQFNNLEPIFGRTKTGLSLDYQTKWNVIKHELSVASQIENWIRRGELQMTNYTIPCSYDQCKQQLLTHCNFFSNQLDLAGPFVLIKDLVNNYNQCADDVKKWKVALEKAQEMWKVYESSKTKLLNWLQEADALLLRSHEPKLDKTLRRDCLENLKNFFSKRDENEQILKQFIVACEDVLSTLAEANCDRVSSRTTLL